MREKKLNFKGNREIFDFLIKITYDLCLNISCIVLENQFRFTKIALLSYYGVVDFPVPAPYCSP